MSAPTTPREVVARLIRTHRLKASGANAMLILYSPEAPAEDADLETAAAIFAALSAAGFAVVKRDALARIRDSYRYVPDAGPEHCGWTSDETEAAWNAVDGALAAAEGETR